jgi:hypothetical protein
MKAVGISPLIVTLELDDRSFGILDGLRKRYFRPERNLVPAHVTLFHQLPGQEEPAISRALEDCCRAQPSFYLLASGLRKLGNGVAVELSSPTLTDIRDTLAIRWRPWLQPQDLQRYRPHVTIQNKVSAAKAQALHDRLAATFVPIPIEARGLLLWGYQGGPWDLRSRFSFGEGSG